MNFITKRIRYTLLILIRTVKGVMLLSLLVSSDNQGDDLIIRRDTYGVPHIYATSTYDLFYGYGYAVGQDRLFQMEMIKRSVKGEVSEVLGADYVSFDKSARRVTDFLSIQKQYKTISASDRDIFEGYAHGINAWIEKVNQSPEKLLPREFMTFEFKPKKWTALDVVYVFVGTMCNRYSDFNTEIENLKMLQLLKKKHGKQKAMQIFNQLNWKKDDSALVTIQDKEISHVDASTNSYPQLAEVSQSSLYQLVPIMLDPFTAELKKQSSAQNFVDKMNYFGRTGTSGSGGYPHCSNIVIVGKDKSKDATSILLNGPQFGWFNPSYVYSVGLHGAGYDLVGNTPFAYPVILFGKNKDIAWGSTAGFGDIVDIYQEKLSEKDSTQYYFNGKYNKMTAVRDTIRVKEAPFVVLNTYATVHGRVVAWDSSQNIAYTKKRGWRGKELSSMLGWLHCVQAKDYQEWRDQAKRMAISINWYYADKEGNIGYIHNGAFPDRKPGHDHRLPAIGTGEMEWNGIKSFETNPQVYNPSNGYIVNWNNAPDRNALSPDMFFISWTEADRVRILDDELNTQEHYSPEDVKDIIKRASFRDVYYDHFVPLFNEILKNEELNTSEQALLSTLNRWNGYKYDNNDDDIYDDPGYTVLKSTLTLLLKELFEDDIPMPFYQWYSSTGYRDPEEIVFSSGSNLQPGTKVLYKVLKNSNDKNIYDFCNRKTKASVLKKVFKKVYSDLSKHFNNQSIDKWLSPVAKTHYLSNNFLGIPQSESTITRCLAMNRGTQNDLVIFKKNGKDSFNDVVAPGQSGFVRPDGTTSAHYQDQLSMYCDYDYKEVPFSISDVKKQASSIQIIDVNR